MSPTLSEIASTVENAPTVSHTQQRRNTLHVYLRDRPREFEVTIQTDDGIQVIEIDTMGGGRIGGVEFESANNATSYIRSV